MAACVCVSRPPSYFAVEEEEGGGHSTAGDSLTTSERKMLFQEVWECGGRADCVARCQWLHGCLPLSPDQRLRQIASRKREPSPYEKARAALLDDLLLILQ